MSKIDPRVEARIIEVISGVTACTAKDLCADFGVMLVVQGENAFGVVQLAHDFRARTMVDESWRAVTARELRDYADAIESGAVQLGDTRAITRCEICGSTGARPSVVRIAYADQVGSPPERAHNLCDYCRSSSGARLA